MTATAKYPGVFVRENEALMAYIHPFTRDAQIAEDLFQETMLIAWRKFDEFDSRQSLSMAAWHCEKLDSKRSENKVTISWCLTNRPNISLGTQSMR